MELRHLRYFLAVAESLNFTVAAKKLGIAQPPLSTQIKQLESQLGQPLFHRSSRKVILTEAGLVFSREAATILQQADTLTAKMADLRDGRSAGLTIRIDSDLASFQIAKQLRKFTKKHRGIRCEIQFSNRGFGEFHRQVDVMIADRSEMPEWPALDLGASPLYLAVSKKHRLADREFVDVEDLVGEHLLRSPIGSETLAERKLLSGGSDAVSRLAGEWVGGGLHERLWRAEAGLGTAVISQEDANPSGVTAVRFSPEAGALEPMLAYRDECGHGGVAALVAHFTESSSG